MIPSVQKPMRYLETAVLYKSRGLGGHICYRNDFCREFYLLNAYFLISGLILETRTQLEQIILSQHSYPNQCKLGEPYLLFLFAKYNPLYYISLIRCSIICACLLSCFSPVQLFVTYGLQSMGIFQERILEWVAMPSSRVSSQPRYRICISYVPALAGGFSTTGTTWEAHSPQQQVKVYAYIPGVKTIFTSNLLSFLEEKSFSLLV